MTKDEWDDFLYNLVIWGRIIVAGLAVWALVEVFA